MRTHGALPLVVAVVLASPFLMGAGCGEDPMDACEENPLGCALGPTGDFSVEIVPSQAEVAQGGTVTLKVVVTNFADVSSTNLLATVPLGVSASFPGGDNTMDFNWDQEGTLEIPLTIGAPTGYALGTFQVEVMATLGPTGSGFRLPDESASALVLVIGAAFVVIEDEFDDGSPVDGRWRRELAHAAGGVTDSVRHESTGGNPDGYRYMMHAFPDSGQISVWHFYTGGVYVPSEQGAISHLIYQEDRVHIDKPTPGAAIGTLFIAEQGGTVYYALVSPGNAFSNEVWERLVTPALAATDFSPAGLDFSAAGDTISFGYLRSNTNHGHVALTLKHGIDNWRVEVHRQ